MSDKNKLGSPFVGSRRIGRRRRRGRKKGRKEAKRKREKERLFHSLLPAFLHFIFSRGWVEEPELEPEDEDEKRSEGGTGWSHNAADIAKELHVTREFVYTVSVPLPSSGNVH